MSDNSAIVHFKDGATEGWYFWDETGATEYGPYSTREGAELALIRYARMLDGEAEDPTIAAVNTRISDILGMTTERLIQANTKRGNAWEAIGSLGLFLEVRTMFLRLRALLWDGGMPKQLTQGELIVPDEYKKQVCDCLLDLRAYATLLQMAVQDENWIGNKTTDEYLKDVNIAEYEKNAAEYKKYWKGGLDDE